MYLVQCDHSRNKQSGPEFKGYCDSWLNKRQSRPFLSIVAMGTQLFFKSVKPLNSPARNWLLFYPALT